MLNLTNKQLLGLFICVCIALCTTVAHNTAHNRPGNFCSYPQNMLPSPWSLLRHCCSRGSRKDISPAKNLLHISQRFAPGRPQTLGQLTIIRN